MASSARPPAERSAGSSALATRLDAADRRDQVVPEKQRIVVSAIERDPGEGAVVELIPLREQNRLTEAGRGNDENGRRSARHRSLREPPARHDARATKTRRMKLGAEER